MAIRAPDGANKYPEYHADHLGTYPKYNEYPKYHGGHHGKHPKYNNYPEYNAGHPGKYSFSLKYIAKHFLFSLSGLVRISSIRRPS